MMAGRISLLEVASLSRIGRRLGGSAVTGTPAEAAPSSRALGYEDRVLEEQVQRLSAGLPATIFNLVNAVIVAALLWASFPHKVLAAWLAATALVVAGRLLLVRSYKADRGRLSPAAWAKRFAAGAALSGALWGGLAVLSAFSGGLVEHVFVAFVIAGTTAGGLGTLTPYLPAYLAYLASAVVPLALAFLVHVDPVYLGMGVLTLLYLVVMAMTARNYSRYVADTIRLQIENRDLNKELTAARNAAARASREKWEALAHLSHELRTPMNAVLGFSESMQTEVFGPLGHPRYLEYSRHVHDSGRHVLDLVTEILTLAEAEAGNLTLALEEVNPASLVRGCVGLLAKTAETRSIRLIEQACGDAPDIVADRLKLRQVLLNLLSNGIKYTRPGGEVRIATRCEGDRLAIVVSDNGIGMSPDDVPKALQPFVRLQSPLTHAVEGTGLGLPLCKRFVELHGGLLEIATAPNRGTTVTVLLPTAPPAAAHR